MKKNGSLQTPFHNAAKSSVDSRGAGVAQSNGYDMRGGQKGTAGKMEEVTTVNLPTGANLTTATVDGVANQR